MDKKYFHIEDDIYVCGVYLWGEESPAYNIVNVDLFDIIQNDINYYQTIGNVYLTGDFNSRVGCKPDYIVNDCVNTYLDDDSYSPDVPLPRASLDNTSNSYGNKLLDLCKATGMRIMNGRLGQGTDAFTFISAKGMSVIDYVIAHESNFARVGQFTIDSSNEWSDHTPVYFSLLCNLDKSCDNESSMIKVSWDDQHRDIYRAHLIGKLPDFNKLTNNIDSSSRSGINNLTNDFTGLFCEITEPLFHKHIPMYKAGTFSEPTILKHKDFFDMECVTARHKYLDALANFNRLKCIASRQYLHSCKTEYKKIVKKKKYTYKLKRLKEIENLKNSNPKEFWKYFKNKKKQQDSNITLDQFRDFFAGLSSDVSNANDNESERFCNSYDFNTEHAPGNNNNCNLDEPISVIELQKAVKLLKKGKSSGSDNILNEYFIEGIDIIASHICDVFNAILSTGFFPDIWSEGLIIPLHKKGNTSDVNNYRGITLVSCLAKLFSSILNKRLETFCEKDRIITDAQFGFRKGRSTTDASFVLLSTVQKYLNRNKRLHACFIDMQKCFDSIYRNGLWYKLYNMGIQGKFLRIIKDMYSNVKSCVKLCNNNSDFFEYAVGLRQGEVMSPILFSLFVNDIEENIINDNINLDDSITNLLLFADDMVIIGNSPTDLQNKLNNLAEYCKKWGLTVNINKTKAMVFRKRGRLLPDENWTFEGKNIESVDDLT